MSNQTVALQSYIRGGGVQERLTALLGERASDFTTSLMSVVNSNPTLQQCQPESVVKAAITAAAMRLPINQNLGFAYIVPYKNKGQYEAQFQMGYKGFIQLAQRSGLYQTINVTDVRDGELVGRDRLSGDNVFEWIDDELVRVKKPVIGYVAYFKLRSGFEKSLFMSQDEINRHAKKYSQSFRSGKGLWAEDDMREFMAQKTVLKLLISRFGPASTDVAMQQALQADQSAIGDGFNYVDNTDDKEGGDESHDDQTKANDQE